MLVSAGRCLVSLNDEAGAACHRSRSVFRGANTGQIAVGLRHVCRVRFRLSGGRCGGVRRAAAARRHLRTRGPRPARVAHRPLQSALFLLHAPRRPGLAAHRGNPDGRRGRAPRARWRRAARDPPGPLHRRGTPPAPRPRGDHRSVLPYAHRRGKPPGPGPHDERAWPGQAGPGPEGHGPEPRQHFA